MLDLELAPFAEVRDCTLRTLLSDTYRLFVLLHGRLRALLDVDPSASLARCVAVVSHKNVSAADTLPSRQCLEPLVSDLGARLAAGKQGDLASLWHPLSAREGLPILPLDKATFLNTQARVSRATAARHRKQRNSHSRYWPVLCQLPYH